MSNEEYLMLCITSDILNFFRVTKQDKNFAREEEKKEHAALSDNKQDKPHFQTKVTF